MKEQLLRYSNKYHEYMDNPALAAEAAMPGKAYFIDDNAILSLPRDDGDSRYPYGKDGFNFWTYASGYMHCNEGLYSPFLRAGEGQEPKIAFFAGTSYDASMFSLLSVPVIHGEEDGISRYTVFTSSATYYITETEEAVFGIRAFVDRSRHIWFTLEVVNKTASYLDVKLSTYFNPFLKNAMMENSTDRWFRVVDYHEDKQSFKIETYEERDRLGMATNYGVLSHVFSDESTVKDYSVTTSRYGYVGGARSSLHTAKVVREGQISEPKSISSFTETAICGDFTKVTVADSFRVDMKFAYCFEEPDAVELMDASYTADHVDSVLAEVEAEEAVSAKGVNMTFSEANSNAGGLKLRENVFNGFMDHLKKQVEFCSVIKGYIQLSSFSLIGIRDVFQAIEGYLFWQPEASKAKMLEALGFLSPDGRLPRQYTLPASEGAAPAMDLRPFIDQGVWVISAIATYLRHTKDYDFLNDRCGYHEFVDDHKHIARKLDQEDTVLDHLLKIMDFLLTNRDHDYTKCVLALYGDWNDALDGLGKSKDPNKEYGTGVSVMATLQVYQNVDEMIEILNHVDADKYGTLIAQYRQAQEEIRQGLNDHALTEDRILHGWGDEKSYLVGSTCDPDGLSRDGLTSNAFWILSGLYRDSFENSNGADLQAVDGADAVKDIILEAYKRLDSKYGLKTFHPHFEKGTEGVGRIPNLPRGTAENGATYIHASMFAVMSLFAAGEPELAWEQLAKLLPFTHESVSISPYIAPNSYGYNEDLGIDGESMADWQTGSSNVLLKTIIRYVYGYEPVADGIVVQPASWQPFDSLNFDVKYRGYDVKIDYVKGHVGRRGFTVNGAAVSGIADGVMKMDRLHLSDTMIDRYVVGGKLHIVVTDPK